MNRHLRAFLAGLLLVIPFAATIWIIWALAAWLGGIGFGILDWTWMALTGRRLAQVLGQHWGLQLIAAITGAVMVLAAIYLVGLLVDTLLMRRAVRAAERIIQRMPGAKTIYQSIRDLLKLFGSGGTKMGKVVLYRPGGGQMGMLGILTNENPTGLAGLTDCQMVAIYLPLAYMLGGPILYVPRQHLQELDIPHRKNPETVRPGTGDRKKQRDCRYAVMVSGFRYPVPFLRNGRPRPNVSNGRPAEPFRSRRVCRFPRGAEHAESSFPDRCRRSGRTGRRTSGPARDGARLLRHGRAKDG